MSAHRLNLLEVELRLGEVDHAHRLIDRLSALRTTGIAPLLSRVFDAASPPGRLHRIDRLDLDLGQLPVDGFEQALLLRLEEVLRRALAQALQQPSATHADTEAARDWLEIRCRTGLLPWWAQASADQPGPPGGDAAAAAQQIQVLRAGSGWQAWLASLADAPVALRRLASIGGAAAIALDDDAATAALQAAAAELAQRLQGDGPVQAAAAGPVGADVLAAGVDTPDGVLASAGALAWRVALLAALARDGVRGVPAVIDTALRLLPDALRQRLIGVMGAIGTRGTIGAISATHLPARSPEAAGALGRLAAAGQGMAAPPDGGRAASRAPQPSASPTAPALQAVVADPGADPDPAADLGVDPAAASRERSAARRLLAAMDWIDVPDAGLVLLSPFIERLFELCGLLTDTRAFLHDAARTRGVLLLAQLSWPEPLPAEPRLALAKLLCGLEPDAPFEPDGPPTAEEAEACAGLLSAALAHAATTMPSLARTSVAGFQTVFLQRPGLLGARNGSWLLQMARRPEDLLLDRLPWGWAWVRLPWMPHPLQVEQQG